MSDKIFDISPTLQSKGPAMPYLEGEKATREKGKFEWIEITPKSTLNNCIVRETDHVLVVEEYFMLGQMLSNS